LLFVGDLRFEQRAGDPVAVDAKPEQHVAVVEHLGRVELQIKRALYRAPARGFEGFVVRLERLKDAQPRRFQEAAAQILGQGVLAEESSKGERSAAGSQ